MYLRRQDQAGTRGEEGAMKENPFRHDEFIPPTTKDGACRNMAISVVILAVVVLGAFGWAAFYGVSEFLARVG
jgi:hypothetical protein